MGRGTTGSDGTGNETEEEAMTPVDAIGWLTFGMLLSAFDVALTFSVLLMVKMWRDM